MTDQVYNYIYSKIVLNGSDIIGYVAYSLYKQEKIEFIQTFKIQHGSEPSDSDLQTFHALTNTDTRIKSYRSQAENILAEFSTEILTNETAKIQSEYDNLLLEELKKSRPFWRGVGESILSNFFSLGIIAFLLLILWSQSIGISAVLGQIFNVDITPKTQILNNVEQKPLDSKAK